LEDEAVALVAVASVVVPSEEADSAEVVSCDDPNLNFLILIS
jgi:hypothetical protein